MRDYHNTTTQGLTPQTSMYNIAVDSDGNMYYQSGNQWLPTLDPATDAIGTTAGDIVDDQYSYEGIPTLFDRTAKVYSGNFGRGDAYINWNNIFNRRGKRYSRELDDATTKAERWRQKEKNFIDRAAKSSHERNRLIRRKSRAVDRRDKYLVKPAVVTVGGVGGVGVLYGLSEGLRYVLNEHNKSMDERVRNYLNTPTGAEDNKKVNEEIRAINEEIKLSPGLNIELKRKKQQLISDYRRRAIEYYDNNN